ncbi:MAG: DUF2780 domain-containing protein [Kiritimatiellae bacterium]|nr:DUF2780 domain-containing protein [Kiritimatiellia bacterium]
MNELISELVSKLGIQEGQAKGGAGLLLKLAQQKLGGDFSKVAAAVPGATEMISSAPEAGGLAKLAGGLLGKLGGGKASGLTDLASLADGFSQLKLDSGMITKFVPVILEFVKGKGGQEVVALLSKVLKK